jgi:hypothetical protein
MAGVSGAPNMSAYSASKADDASYLTGTNTEISGGSA